jgi:hypothetical protein
MKALENLVQSHCNLEAAAAKKALQLQTLFGSKSDHRDRRVLRVVRDDSKVNLEGDRYLTEINASSKNLIDNEGYSHNYNCITLEVFCELLDNEEETLKTWHGA